LVADLKKAKTKIIIPSPALSELLVRAGAEESQRLVEAINRSSIFKIEAFDALAAIEVATMSREAIDAGDKRSGTGSVWQKVKYDRQIAAIAKVHRASVIYTGDTDLVAHCERVGLQAAGIGDLPLPPEDAQIDMFKDLPPEDADIAAAEIAAQIASESPST
jgi:predicted nucleic acid-binding protein